MMFMYGNFVKFHETSAISSFTNASWKWYFNILAKSLKNQATTRKYLLFNVFLTIIATSAGHLSLHS